MYLVSTLMPGETYPRRFRSLLLVSCIRVTAVDHLRINLICRHESVPKRYKKGRRGKTGNGVAIYNRDVRKGRPVVAA